MDEEGTIYNFLAHQVLNPVIKDKRDLCFAYIADKTTDVALVEQVLDFCELWMLILLSICSPHIRSS